MAEAGTNAAIKRIAREKDPLVKHLLIAALCSRTFARRGMDLIVVGGSAIEFYTDGAYMSGDVDLCIASASKLMTIRDRQELMGRLTAKGGPRSWELAGTFVDILGRFETVSKAPPRRLQTEIGEVAVAPPEELLVERVLVSKYPSAHPPAAICAAKLAGSALRHELEMDWNEVRRIANLNEYRNEKDVLELIKAEAEALAVRSPYDSGQ